MTTAKNGPPRGRRDRRTRLFTVRLSEKEGGIADEIVQRTGLSAAALVRRALLDAPPASRRPSAQDRAVQRLLAALGKIGSNVNQLASHAEAGSFDNDTVESIDYAVRDLAELRFVCLQALGYDQSTEAQSDDTDIDD
jgi:hypothetical protein